MNVTVIQATAGGARVRATPAVRVELDGVPTRQLAPTQVSFGRGREGVAASFEWTGGSADFGQARRLIPRGARLRATLPRGAVVGDLDDLPLFDGYVTDCRVQFDGQRRRIVFEAIDGLRHRGGGATLIGQWGRDGSGALRRADDLPLTFNAGGRPDRAIAPASLHGRACHVFAHDGGEATFWSLADAANYLLSAYLADDDRLTLPTVEQIESLCGSVAPRSLELTGRSVVEALDRLAELAGAGFAIEPRHSVRDGAGWRMRWFGTRGDRLIVLRHQRRGQAVSTAQTNVAGGDLRFDHDDAGHVYTALGERERVESTFALRPGWDAALEGGEHRHYSHANASFAAVRDVYRRWVLNEAGDWTAEPFSRGPAADLSALLGGDALLRRRRLLPALSRDAAGRPLGVLVEISLDGGESWQRYPGRIDVLAEEAGVRVADDQLPPEYWQAAVAGSLRVRATATIEGDARVRAERVDPVRSDGRRTVRHLRWPAGRFRYQRVDASSRLAGSPADQVDDRAALAAALDAEMERGRAAATTGQIALPWPSGLYRVGDRVRGIAGQGLAFGGGQAGRPREPLISRMRHDFDERWQTTLELE